MSQPDTPAMGRAPTRRVWPALLLTTVAFATLQLAHNRHLYSQPIYEGQDYAANSMLVIKAKREAVLHGHYSRMGFYHPGPTLIYVLAGSEWVLHDWLRVVPAPHNAHMLGHLLLNAVLLGVALAIVTRAVGRWGGFAAGVAFLVYFAREGHLAEHWFAHTFLLVYLPFQVAAASVAAGRTRHLGWLALTGSLAVHSHASLIAFVVPISLYALVRVWRGMGYRVRGLSPENRRAWVTFVAVVSVFSLPIALHTILHFPGEILKYLDAGRTKRPASGSVGDAAWYMVRTLTNDSEWGWQLVIGVGLGSIVAALTFPPRGRRFAQQLLVIGALSTASMSYYVLRGVDDFKWTYLGIFYGSVLLLGWSLISMRLAVLVRAFVWRALATFVVACVAVWAGTTGQFTNPYAGVPEAPAIVEELCADPRWQTGPPLMTMDTDAWGHGGALLVQFERRGVRPWLLNSAWDMTFTNAFQPDRRPVSKVWQIDAALDHSPTVPTRRVLGHTGGTTFRELETRCQLGAPVPLGGCGRRAGAKPLVGWFELNEHEYLIPSRPCASLLVNLEPCHAREIRLTLGGEGLAAGKTTAGQRVRVVINGEAVGEVAFPNGAAAERTLTFTGKLLEGGVPARIDFEFPDAHRYLRNRGYGPDNVSSIRLTRLVFTAVEP